ncbi:MarR family transcriptional regulator [Stappia sp. BW2]|uniref:MarR family winged helix-turn-helix transcriptional regulator n=1 Tax=Stappia sp. BW2 TaxID=2592622 RepID=UPI0011DE7705|nr:MarR family transcriptional regulator [Stappia sp. BW2]TYC65009.1 MarR family transcriptional regulator [Stappia sp. BW2]
MPKLTDLDTDTQETVGITSETPGASLPDFELETFFPYLVRVFYSDVTRALSAVYQRDYGMMPAEWRTMAILGSASGGLQASEIVARSSMDKVVVSRAVKRMEDRGFLTRESNEADGRSFLLQLSDDGRAAFEDLAPKLKAVEQKMLSGLSAEEIEGFLAITRRIRENLADELQGVID